MNPIARYRAAAARLRALEAAGTPSGWIAGIDGNKRIYGPDGEGEHSGVVADVVRRHDLRLIRASRNLLLPLLNAGDSLADAADLLGILTVQAGSTLSAEEHEQRLAALTALTDAIEREIGGEKSGGTR